MKNERKRLVFIAHRVPYPPDKGERVRAFHEVRALAEQFRLTLVAFARAEAERAAAEALRPWCERILLAPSAGRPGLANAFWALARGRSLTESLFKHPRIERTLRQEAEPFDVAVGYSSGVLPLLLACPARAKVMDLVDVDSAKWEQYARSSGWPKAWLFRREARGVRAVERTAVEHLDAVLLVSDAEIAALAVSSPKVLSIPNGVDTDYFAPETMPASSDSPAPTLVFTGTMDYRPNVEGVCWFARQVWPDLRRDFATLRFTIVGRDPTRAVRRLSQIPGIAVTGSVPDVRPYLAPPAIAVVPLHIARGLQNKVLEAMAMARPVVASGGALEGLEVEVGRDVLRADTPQQWGHEIRRLLGDDSLREALGQMARACVLQKYTWQARLQPFVALCERLSGGSPPMAGRPAGPPAPVATLGRPEPCRAGGQPTRPL